MAKESKINTSQKKTSQLERFALYFEYDKTLRDIKREVRHRTDRNT